MKDTEAKALFICLLAGASLALIGAGLYMIYQPACPLGIGLLLWLFVVYTPRSLETDERKKH